MSKRKSTVIVADDDMTIRVVVSEALRQEGWHVIEAEDIPELKRIVQRGQGDAVISDVVMPGGNGLETMAELLNIRPDLPFIVMSAQNTLSTAMGATNNGAFDYLPKPFDIDELVSAVKKAIKQSGKRSVVQEETDQNTIIGTSSAMQEIYRTMARVVNTELTVLINGESGTGKELVARALHEHGPRRDNPFVAVNMAAIPKELIETELFGHERGAFTGAETRTLGRFGQAKGGTLFLDEIGDMPLEAQTRLLRVLQEGEYRTVGGSNNIKTNTRIIAATNKNLQTMVRDGEFREDLYFRLNVVPLSIPPLRDRPEDIPALAEHFLAKIAESGLPYKTLSDGAKKVLQSFDWPGNVRELENLIRRLCALYPEDQINGATVKAEFDRSTSDMAGGPLSIMANITGGNLSQTVRMHLDQYFEFHEGELPPPGLHARILREIERPLIQKVLAETDGNQVKASELLGLNRNTLRKKIRELDISLPQRT